MSSKLEAREKAPPKTKSFAPTDETENTRADCKTNDYFLHIMPSLFPYLCCAEPSAIRNPHDTLPVRI